MLVYDVMTRGLRMIAPEATVRDAAVLMDRFDLGALPVQESNGRLIGIITDRDIAVRVTAKGRDARMTIVRDVMTPKVTCCYADADARSAIELMERLQVRRLPVVGRDKQPVGMVALADIARRLHDQGVAGEVLERVSEPVDV